MFGLGTVINVVLVIIGGIVGKYFGKFLKETNQKALTSICGVSVMFLSVAGAMEGMLKISDGKVVSQNTFFVVICLLLGGILGEIIKIEEGFEKFGELLKIKSHSQDDNRFVEAFVTASFTVCIGAMTIIGAIKDGIYGDYTILATKSVLDLIIIAVMTSSMGKGAVFSVIPIAVIEGGMTALARLIKPIMTDDAIFFISLIGSILIFCVGINLVFGKKIKVANLLPSLIFAMIYAFIPFRI